MWLRAIKSCFLKMVTYPELVTIGRLYKQPTWFHLFLALQAKQPDHPRMISSRLYFSARRWSARRLLFSLYRVRSGNEVPNALIFVFLNVNFKDVRGGLQRIGRF